MDLFSQFALWCLGAIATGFVCTLFTRGLTYLKNKLFKKS